MVTPRRNSQSGNDFVVHLLVDVRSRCGAIPRRQLQCVWYGNVNLHPLAPLHFGVLTIKVWLICHYVVAQRQYKADVEKMLDCFRLCSHRLVAIYCQFARTATPTTHPSWSKDFIGKGDNSDLIAVKQLQADILMSSRGMTQQQYVAFVRFTHRAEWLPHSEFA